MTRTLDMNTRTIEEALLKQKKILESQGYTVAYICLYGSQNYGLDIYSDEYQSDIDMKAIIVPTLDDLVRDSKPVSTVVETEWGQCDIKDIRTYFQTLLKANPAYIETLFSKYYIVDNNFKEEFDVIFSKREALVKTLKVQFIRAMYGMMCEKEKALCHPYPTIAHKIEKYGFDGKQAHHIFRMWYMMIDYFEEGWLFEQCLTPDKAFIPFLMSLKLNDISLDEVNSLVSATMEEAKGFKDEIVNGIDEKTIDYSIKDEILALSQDIIKIIIINECI